MHDTHNNYNNHSFLSKLNALKLLIINLRVSLGKWDVAHVYRVPCLCVFIIQNVYGGCNTHGFGCIYIYMYKGFEDKLFFGCPALRDSRLGVLYF